MYKVDYYLIEMLLPRFEDLDDFLHSYMTIHITLSNKEKKSNKFSFLSFVLICF